MKSQQQNEIGWEIQPEPHKEAMLRPIEITIYPGSAYLEVEISFRVNNFVDLNMLSSWFVYRFSALLFSLLFSLMTTRSLLFFKISWRLRL